MALLSPVPDFTAVINARKMSDTLQGALYFAKAPNGTLVVVKTADPNLVANHKRRGGKSVTENFLDEIAHLEYLNSFSDKPKTILTSLQQWDETNERGETEWHCLMMERVSGGELFQSVKAFWDGYHAKPDGREMEMWLMRTQCIFQQLVRAIAWMHSKGIVHLDISPENIMLDELDRIRVVDFGMSRRCTDGDFRMRGFRGKKGYMAPEIFGHKEYDGQLADIFSAGAVLFLMMCGATDEKRLYLNAVMDNGIRTMTRRWEYGFVPEDALDLLDRMLKKEEERITMSELLVHPFMTGQVDVDELDQETFSLFQLDQADFCSSTESIRQQQDVVKERE